MPCSCGKGEEFKKMLSLLLAEDDDSLRETLSLFFSSQGFQVFQAGSGNEAIEIAMKKKISFSVMDINMPGLGGIEAFKLITRERGRMPCIFMSGDSSLDVLQRALNVGGFTFISKPIHMELMRSSVDRLIMKFFRERLSGEGWQKKGR
ncbi:MAG: response regulator [Planctomycetota bacterium]|jgi:two-component system response regulator PilR (NtrC family)